MSLLLPGEIAGGATVVRADTMDVRQAEPVHDQIFLHSGLELVDAALEFFFFGGGKLSVAPAANSAGSAGPAVAMVDLSAG